TPSLCSGLPDSISAESAATVAVTPPEAMVSASSSEISRPATGLRPAAVRSRADAAPPIEVPSELREGEALFAGIFLAGLPPPLTPPRKGEGDSESLVPGSPREGLGV